VPAAGTDKRATKVKPECPIPGDRQLTVEGELAGTRCGIVMEGCATFRARCSEPAGGPSSPPGARGAAKYEMEKKESALSLGSYVATRPASFTSAIEITLKEGLLQRISWVTGPSAKAFDPSTSKIKEYGDKVTIPLLDLVSER
jgi:hypothetical protein